MGSSQSEAESAQASSFFLKRQLRHFVIRFRQLAPIPIIPLAKIDS